MGDLAGTLSGAQDFPPFATGGFMPFKDLASTLGNVALDMTPVIGDVRNAQAGMEAFSKGDKLGMGLAALGAIPGVGLLAKGAKAVRRIAKTSDIGSLITRPITSEDALVDFVNSMRSAGVHDDVIDPISRKVQIGFDKGIKANDPAFVDAADDLMVLAEKALIMGKTGDKVPGEPLERAVKNAVETIEKTATTRKQGRMGLKVESRVSRSNEDGDVIQEMARFEDSKPASGTIGHNSMPTGSPMGLMIHYRGSPNNNNKAWSMVFDISEGTVEEARSTMTRIQRMRILATVEDSLDRFIPRETPGVLSFSAARPELNRVYDAAIKSKGRKHGYEVSIQKAENLDSTASLGDTNNYTMARKGTSLAKDIEKGVSPEVIAQRQARMWVDRGPPSTPATGTHPEDAFDLAETIEFTGTQLSDFREDAVAMARALNIGGGEQELRTIAGAVDILAARTRSGTAANVDPDEAMDLAFQALQTMDRF